MTSLTKDVFAAQGPARKALVSLATTLSGMSGADLFDKVCHHLVNALKVDYAFVPVSSRSVSLYMLRTFCSRMVSNNRQIFHGKWALKKVVFQASPATMEINYLVSAINNCGSFSGRRPMLSITEY